MFAKKMQNNHRHFGGYGGRYVPEMLIPALDELEKAYFKYREDVEFTRELDFLLRNYAGRPTPLYYAKNLTEKLGGARIYLKLESHAYTGAHKINNVLGQMLLASKMGKKEVVAETGAGQHGLATATAAAKFGMKCRIFMGEVDMNRQYPNVYSMELLGAEVIPVRYGSKTLKDAVNAALKYWTENLGSTHYLLGSTVGPFPYPLIVRDFQTIIGREVKWQLAEYESRGPDVLIACVGGGSNSMGLFYPFIKDEKVKLFGIEGGGRSPGAGDNAVKFGEHSSIGIIQGFKSYFLQDRYGRTLNTHSISAGLNFTGVGPELAYLKDNRRIEFSNVSDLEALEAYKMLARTEGIISALESAHAVAFATKIAPDYPNESIMVINISGRGDKDIFIAAKAISPHKWISYLQSEVDDVKSH